MWYHAMWLFRMGYLLVVFPGMYLFIWSLMVLLLCTNYGTGKEEGHLYLVLLNLSPWVPLFVSWMFAIGGKKSTTSDITSPLLQCWWFLCLLYNSKCPTHSARLLALYYFSTPEVQPSRQSSTLGSVVLYAYQKAIVSTQKFSPFYFFLRIAVDFITVISQRYLFSTTQTSSIL